MDSHLEEQYELLTHLAEPEEPDERDPEPADPSELQSFRIRATYVDVREVIVHAESLERARAIAASFAAADAMATTPGPEKAYQWGIKEIDGALAEADAVLIQDGDDWVAQEPEV